MIAQNNFPMLKLIMTPQDLKQIATLIDTKLDQQTKKLDARFDDQDKKFDAKLDAKLREQTRSFNIKLDTKLAEQTEKLEGKMFKWRSDVMNSVDALAKEIHDESEFREIASHQIEENRERTDRLEKKVFGVVVG